MAVEIAITELTAQTTELLDTVTSLSSSVTQTIIDAVIVSENAALEPLLVVSTNLIDTQTLLVTLISEGI